MHVSITGLRLRGPLQTPRFWWHALRSMAQARRAPGNLAAEARTIDGVHHTLSAWTDKAAMRAYLAAGAHRQAMRAFPALATGRVVGFTADTVPDWAAAHAIWRDQAREVSGHRPAQEPKRG